jgi:hypothetical protein
MLMILMTNINFIEYATLWMIMKTLGKNAESLVTYA